MEPFNVSDTERKYPVKPVVTLHSDQPVPFAIRTITADDIELLRTWKNAHRKFFFYKEIISEEQQQAWFKRWLLEEHDHLFIVEVDKRSVGCIGTRLFQGTADVYNVILGDKQFKGSGIMSEALLATVAFSQFLYSGLPVCVRVLQDNPAIGWYERNGFTRIMANEEFVTLKWARPVVSRFQCNMSLQIPFQHV
jgi:RimJ/RimL family protein N-acetyltransferase